MITILLKDKQGKIYTASSFDDKLEKEVNSKPEDNGLLLKHLAKEFEIDIQSIHKYWIS